MNEDKVVKAIEGSNWGFLLYMGLLTVWFATVVNGCGADMNHKKHMEALKGIKAELHRIGDHDGKEEKETASP